MDILISSNLERLIYKIAGNDDKKNLELMQQLSNAGRYDITDDMKAELKDFYGNYADEKDTAEIIKKIYKNSGYVIDTHTAVAASVFEKYRAQTGDKTVTVIASTASPYKFTRSVMNAIDETYDSLGDFELVDELEKISGVSVPQAIQEIRNAKVIHNHVCEVTKMPEAVRGFLK